MTLFLNKHFSYSFEDMIKIGILAQKKFNIDLTKLKILMVYDVFVLYRLEEIFINKGIFFEWIDYENEPIGIIAKVNKDYHYQSLNEYQKYRNIIDLKNTYKFKEILEFQNKKEKLNDKNNN